MASVHEFATKEGLAPPISCRALTDRFGVRSIRDAFASELIHDFHRRMGGIFGRLGPLNGSLAGGADGSYTQGFQLGQVNLANIDGPLSAVTEYDAEVSLAAVKCFGTEDTDLIGDPTDSTYAVISLVSVDPGLAGTDQLVLTDRTFIQDNVKPSPHENSVIFKATTLKPFPQAFPGSGIAIHVAIWDHESGDADEIKDKIHSVLNDAANKAASALAGAAAADDPAVTSGTVGDITQFEIGGIRPFDILTGDLAKVIADQFADVLVGEHTFLISAQQVVDLADQATFTASLRTSPDLDPDVTFNWPPTLADEVLLTDGHGSYKAYFKVRGSETTKPVG